MFGGLVREFLMMVFTNRIAVFLAALMLAASVGAILARPTKKIADERAEATLERIVPRAFGDWREDPRQIVQVVNPQTQELLDKLYSQVLSRVYVNSNGYRIMLSLAYGSDQRGTLQAHMPDICYPAQGFVVQKSSPTVLPTAYGEIPARRLITSMGSRHEPVTYWFTVGGQAVQSKIEKRLVDLRFGLSGRIPDGMIFRVSSIDRNEANAYFLQDQFIGELLGSVSPFERKRLSGLGIPAT